MMFRIQKLLMCEYNNFEETVLVESPFAQVSEMGTGIRQVQLALTPTKLVIGVDSFDKTSTYRLSNVYNRKQDPETECMELISLLPLDFLYIKIFRKGSRQLMKVSIGGLKMMLFEFGGHLFKNLYWNVWRDRIAGLRTIQNKYFTHVTNPPISSSSSETAPTSIQVVAQVHCNDNGVAKLMEQNSDLNKFHENTNLVSISKRDVMENKKFPDDGGATEKNNNYTLKEVAQYFLDTQSEIILWSSDRDTCDGSCVNAGKSTSLANVYSCISW